MLPAALGVTPWAIPATVASGAASDVRVDATLSPVFKLEASESLLYHLVRKQLEDALAQKRMVDLMPRVRMPVARIAQKPRANAIKTTARGSPDTGQWPLLSGTPTRATSSGH